jgi:glutaredoxin 3
MRRVVVYTGDFCGYCDRAKALLDRKGVPYEEVRLPSRDPHARLRLAELTGGYTIPQIVVGGRPIGGWDQLQALERAGRLDEVLAGE